MKNILFVTYHLWPKGLSAVRRITNFSKNLSKNGFECTILAAEPVNDELSFHFKKKYDGDLGVLENVKVVAIPTFENLFIIRLIKKNKVLAGILNFLLLPDLQIIWIFSAVRACLKMVKEDKVDAVYVTSQPNSTQFIGLIVSWITRVPWIAEFRDPWIQFFLKSWPTRLHYWADRFLEKLIYKNADEIVVVTPMSKTDLVENNPFLNPACIHVIPNGYSSESFLSLKNIKEKNKFTISFIGRTYWPYYYDNNEKATLAEVMKRNFLKYSVTKVDRNSTTPYCFLEAVNILLAKYPELSSKIEVEFVGAVWRPMEKIVRRFSLEDVVSIKGFISHSACIEKMHNADVLLYILGQSKSPLYTVAARLYEYMASMKPILALVPEGDSANFLKKSGLAFFANPTDSEDIAKVIYKLYEKWEKGLLEVSFDKDFIEKFEYENLTRDLSLVFKNLKGKK